MGTTGRWRRVLSAPLAAVCAGVTLCVSLSGCSGGFGQRSLLYHPAKVDAAKLTPVHESIVPISTRTSDGLTLHGWRYRLPSAKRVVLYFPGNAGNRGHRYSECSFLRRLGCEVVIFDYRGFGENQGAPSEEGFARDAEAIWDELVLRERVPPDRIVIYGESLGGAIATRLAEQRCREGAAPQALVLRSTFASMTEVAGHHATFLPVSLLLVDRFPSDQRIANVTCPIMQIHGDADTLVTPKMAERLHAAAPDCSASGQPKKWVFVERAGHNDVLEVGGQQLAEEVGGFFAALDQ